MFLHAKGMTVHRVSASDYGIRRVKFRLSRLKLPVTWTWQKAPMRRSALKTSAAVAVINSQFGQRCCSYLEGCCWGSKGGVCQKLQSGEGFICLFSQPLQSWALCGSSIRAPRQLDPPASFTHHRLFFALFCPEAACISSFLCHLCLKTAVSESVDPGELGGLASSSDV